MSVIFDVGHYSFPRDPGTVNPDFGITENEWCTAFTKVCQLFALSKRLYECRIIKRESTILELSTRINQLNPKLVVSFHLNGFKDPYVGGTETLYYRTSTNGQYAAEVFQRRIVRALQLRDRGIKPSVLPQLWMVNAPIVILEPFFLTSSVDLNRAHNKFQALTEAVVYGAEEVLKGLN